MTKLPSGFFAQRALHARILAGLLLVLVLHGATAGITHSHRRSSVPRVGQLTAAAASFASATSDSSIASQRTCKCLICQLQQNLSITVLSKAPRLHTELISRTYQSPAVICYASEPPSQGQGRAPPLTFLL